MKCSSVDQLYGGVHMRETKFAVWRQRVVHEAALDVVVDDLIKLEVLHVKVVYVLELFLEYGKKFLSV